MILLSIHGGPGSGETLNVVRNRVSASKGGFCGLLVWIKTILCGVVIPG